MMDAIRAFVLRHSAMDGRSLLCLAIKCRAGAMMSNRDEKSTAVASLVSSIRAGSTYSVLLVGLHTARRLLITQIEDANRAGASTTSLERDLRDNRRATRQFLAYLEGHA